MEREFPEASPSRPGCISHGHFFLQAQCVCVAFHMFEFLGFVCLREEVRERDRHLCESVFQTVDEGFFFF